MSGANEIIERFSRAYPSRRVDRLYSTVNSIYVIEAPERNDNNREVSNMFISQGTVFIPFNPINDLNAYSDLMGKAKLIWSSETISHSAVGRRWHT